MDTKDELQALGLRRGDDGKVRCSWHGDADDYRLYHDTEWGFPVKDERRLFEKICLEGFQSGLSWITVLRKRENFRAAFHNFEMDKVAAMAEVDVDRLVLDAGIIRHRKKIESTINNARRAIELRKEFGSLPKYFWSFESVANEGRPSEITNAYIRANPTTETSTHISKDLKKRGWSFVGPTTVYAFMQAMGMVNDHAEGCFLREQCLTVRAEFNKP